MPATSCPQISPNFRKKQSRQLIEKKGRKSPRSKNKAAKILTIKQLTENLDFLFRQDKMSFLARVSPPAPKADESAVEKAGPRSRITMSSIVRIDNNIGIGYAGRVASHAGPAMARSGRLCRARTAWLDSSLRRPVRAVRVN